MSGGNGRRDLDHFMIPYQVGEIYMRQIAKWGDVGGDDVGLSHDRDWKIGTPSVERIGLFVLRLFYLVGEIADAITGRIGDIAIDTKKLDDIILECVILQQRDNRLD